VHFFDIVAVGVVKMLRAIVPQLHFDGVPGIAPVTHGKFGDGLLH